MQDNGDIIEYFNELTQDALDEDTAYRLLNQVDALIRNVRPWEILKKLDETKTRSSGDSYTTAKTLPSDFSKPHKLLVGVGQGALKRVPFDEQHIYRNVPGAYFIDFKNGTYYIANGTWTGTIYNYYIYKPARLTSDGASSTLTSPVFPSDFWPYYAIKMAEVFMGGIDQDERSLQSVPQFIRTGKELWDAMIAWDADLKENDLLQRGYREDSAEPIIDLGRL